MFSFTYSMICQDSFSRYISWFCQLQIHSRHGESTDCSTDRIGSLLMALQPAHTQLTDRRIAIVYTQDDEIVW